MEDGNCSVRSQVFFQAGLASSSAPSSLLNDGDAAGESRVTTHMAPWQMQKGLTTSSV